jgi:hypothetical protein
MTQAQIDGAILNPINADALTALKDYAEAARIVAAGEPRRNDSDVVAKNLAWIQANDNALNTVHAGGAPGLAIKVLNRAEELAGTFISTRIKGNLVDRLGNDMAINAEAAN